MQVRSRSILVKSLVAICLLAPFASAQTVRWGIPERGVVFYQRDLRGPRAAGRQRTGFLNVLMPPVLLEGELDQRKQYIRLPPQDFRDVAAWLAFDLRHTRSKGNFRRVIPFLMGIGAVHIKGRWGTPDDDGIQTIKATLSRKQTERGKIPERVYNAFYNTWNQQDLNGTIQITRKVDREKGLVRRLSPEKSSPPELLHRWAFWHEKQGRKNHRRFRERMDFVHAGRDFRGGVREFLQ